MGDRWRFRRNLLSLALVAVVATLLGASCTVAPPPPPPPTTTTTTTVRPGNGVKYDFDQDGKADIVWFEPGGGWRRYGQAGYVLPVVSAADEPLTGDFDNDGVWELGLIHDFTDWITTGS